MIDIKGKVVLITGAASGLGKILSRKFGLAGASVMLSDLQAELGEAEAAQLRSDGIAAEFCAANLNNENEIVDCISACKNIFGSLDILVNNARPPLKNLSFPSSMSEWDLAMLILLKAPALAVAAALPELERSGNGVVINISSTNAYHISHQPLGYHVAKAALIQLTRHLAYELGPKGIRVNAICPGLIELMDKKQIAKSNSRKQLITETIVPLGRAAQADEIADLALFLASDMSSYINGQAIIIDGGMTLGCQYHSAMQVLNKSSI